MKRLYVLIDQKLDAVYGCVQGGHAVAQWLLEHPNQEWNNSYLIYLYADLDKWKVRLDLVNKDYSSLFESSDRNYSHLHFQNAKKTNSNFLYVGISK